MGHNRRRDVKYLSFVLGGAIMLATAGAALAQQQPDTGGNSPAAQTGPGQPGTPQAAHGAANPQGGKALNASNSRGTMTEASRRELRRSQSRRNHHRPPRPR